MSCTQCDATLDVGDRFCASCGNVVRQRGRVTWDWRGSLHVAGVTLGTSAVLALVFGLTSRPSSEHLHWDLKTTIAWVAWVWESIFGVDASGSANLRRALTVANFHGSAAGHLGLSAMPLTLTFITFLAAAIAYRRVISRSPHLLSALLTGVSAAVVSAVVLVAVSLIVSVNAHDLSQLLRPGNGTSDLNGIARSWQQLHPGISLSLTMSTIGAAFVSVALLITVFAAITLTRTDWLPLDIGKVANRCLTPIFRGFGRLMAALVASGLAVELITWIVRKETKWPHGIHTAPMTFHQWVTAFSGAIAYAGNAGLMSLGLGSFGKVDYQWAANASFGGSDITWPGGHHDYGLASLAQRNNLAAGIWVAAILTPIVLIYVASSLTRMRGLTVREQAIGLASWICSLLVVVPILVALANLSVSGTLTAQGSVAGNQGVAAAHGSASAGLETWPTTFFVIAYAGVISAVVVVVAMRKRGISTDISRRAGSL